MINIKYKCIHSNDPKKLSDLVAKEMDSGWIPQGGVSVAIDYQKGIIYAQAMVWKHFKD